MAEVSTVKDGAKVRMMKLKDIVSNTAQSRGMGVMGNLLLQGYGVFEKVNDGDDKEPIWDMLLSGDDNKQAMALSLIQTAQPEIAELAAKIHSTGQLQPIGVQLTKEGKGDVIFGMRRTLAAAINKAKYGKDAPDVIEAKVFEGKKSPIDLMFMALAENDDREDESPIDKAITFQRISKETKMKPAEIGKRIRLSDQSVRNYLNLLDPKLADKRFDIHTGKMTIDKAMNLLRQRKGTTTQAARGSAGEGARFRLPGVKGLLKIYNAPKKPKNMTEDEWELWVDPAVRKLLAYKLGLEYTEYDAKAAKEAEEAEEKALAEAEERKTKEAADFKTANAKKAEGNGKESSDKPTARRIIKIKRARANKLLTALDKPSCVKWKDDFIKSKLENMVNLVEEGTKLEDAGLDKLMHTLIDGYKDELIVEIVKDGESVE